VRRATGTLLVVVFLFAACGGDDDSTHEASAEGDSSPLNVFAASSLTEVFSVIDGDPRYQFAGSDDLALQIKEGAPADVFAAASPTYPTELHEAGLVEEPVAFATNELILIAPKDNPAQIESVDDLRDPDVKLVIGAEGVPVGDYTREILKNLDASDVLDQVVSEEQDVKGVVSKVRLGEADAGFVYATDVVAVQGDVTSIQLPPQAQPVVGYQIAVVSDSNNHEAAEEFVARVTGDNGRYALEAAGFGLP
jgi:molybdate transport system substrate-binding protein